MIEVTPYSPPNFWTLEGTILKQRQLKKVFPCVFNWRFVTLTFNRKRYSCPAEAYHDGINNIRHFVEALRHRFGYSIRRYCWKLEMHPTRDEQGRLWPHFHLFLDYKREIDLTHLNRAWGKRGRTDIRRIKDRTLDYGFKYITKDIGYLPEWLTSLHKPRAFQTSRNFYKQNSASDGQDVSKQEASPRPVGEDRANETKNNVERPRSTLGERLKRWSLMAVTRTLCQRSGKWIYRGIEMTSHWGDTLTHFALTAFNDFRRPESDCRIVNKQKIVIPCHKMLMLLPLKNPLRVLMAVS